MKKISVLLVDDHAVVRQGFRSLFAAEADIEVVGEAENGRQAVRLAQKLRPDVVVMDIAMPQLNGLEATRQIVGEGLPCRVLILSAYADNEYVQQLTQAGAAGYVIKQAVAGDLIAAVREIARGNPFLSPSILKRLLVSYRGGKPGAKNRATAQKTQELTSREQEVLQLVAEGQLNKQIAAVLSLSIKTVEKHRQQLMNKLNLHDIAGLTRYAIAHGVVESLGRISDEPQMERAQVEEAAPPKAAERP